MPRKYIKLRLSAAEIDRVQALDLKLNPIAHQAIDRWQTLDDSTRSQAIQDRQILYILNPIIVKVIGADRPILDWFEGGAIGNESLILSTAIGYYLGDLNRPLVLPPDLTNRLKFLGGDPIKHLKLAINKYLDNC